MQIKKFSNSIFLSYRGSLNQLPREHIDWLTHPVRRFLKIEAMAGFVLLFFTIFSLCLANSRYSDLFNSLWHISIGINIGNFEYERSLHGWINDAAMTLFFFLIALELKRELVLGELRNPRLAMLSISAALGGMLVPALIYLLLQFGEPGQHGWGIVMATDTAFVIGCLALIGQRIPKSLRIFMLSLAVVDDIGAIIVVAFGYSSGIDWPGVGLALLGFMVIKIMAFIGIRSLSLFFIVGAIIWVAVDASGIHPTVTGVILGLMTPTSKWVSDDRLHAIMDSVMTDPLADHGNSAILNRQTLKMAEAAAREALSPVERLEIMLHPWVGFIVMPLFAFANAGIPLTGTDFSSALTAAVFLGFVLGKPIGIFLFSWIAVKFRLAILPTDLHWGMILGGGMLAGIGFTMSLFIANLAFNTDQINAAKFGIFLASIFSGVTGFILLRYCLFITPHSDNSLNPDNQNPLEAKNFNHEKTK